MQVDSKFLWLSQPTKIGADISGWRVCWLGGWDKHRVFFIVMVDKPKRAQKLKRPAKQTIELRKTAKSLISLA